jgi:hypothetical protein
MQLYKLESSGILFNFYLEIQKKYRKVFFYRTQIPAGLFYVLLDPKFSTLELDIIAYPKNIHTCF